jgi:hypothetical protein
VVLVSFIRLAWLRLGRAVGGCGNGVINPVKYLEEEGFVL